MKKTIDVSIIVVSHKSGDLLPKAIRAVHTTVKKHSYELIIVENMSNDGSYEALKKTFPKDTIIQTSELLGFSAANNRGAAEARGTYLFFLNPDTEVREGAVDTLVDAMKQNPRCGAISGQLLNTDGSIQPQGGALPTLLNVNAWMLFIDDLPGISSWFPAYQRRSARFFTKVQQNYGWVGGTAIMMPAAVFRALGGWDNRIFLYGEDVELCKRIHDAGYSICLTPEAKILHHGHSGQTSARSLVGEIDGIIYFWRKHKPAWQMPFLLVLLFVGAWLRVFLFGILMGDDVRYHAYLEAQRHTLMA